MNSLWIFKLIAIICYIINNECVKSFCLAISIGVARGGHGRAFALPSLNFALPSKPSSCLKFNILYKEELTWTCSVSMAWTRPRTQQ